MIAFDTDILSEVISQNSHYLVKAASYPSTDLYVPVVAVVEVFRGQLHSVRQAEAGRGKVTLATAYLYFQESATQITKYQLLAYTHAADQEYNRLKSLKLKIGINDLRIAATAITHGIKLVTRNARDFQQVPGLQLEVWP